MPPLRIAIVGTRGLPANYGGFETFAQELSTRLVQRGHSVTVYCRSHYFNHPEKEYHGVRLVVLPALRTKYFDTVSHTGLSIFHLLFRKYDVVLVCNAANAVFTFLPRLVGKKVLLNVDGLERKRKKWNALGRIHYRLSEWLSCFLPNVLVTDARTIQDYFYQQYNKPSTMIPYGADDVPTPPGPTLDALHLNPDQYFLYVSRLEPENNAHLVVKIFEKLATDFKLVVVGDAPYNKKYIRSLKSTRDPRIIFPGAIYGNGYRELISNPFCYIHATEIGGTHPALIENMAVGNRILFLDTPENREVAEDTGLPFSSDDLDGAVELFQALNDSPHEYDHLKERARERARRVFSWEKVVDGYIDVFHSLLPRKS